MEKEFKDILSDERHKRRATQRQMADQLGISEKMYSQYESGKYLGGPTKVSKYLDKLYGKKIAQDTDIDAIDLHKNEGVPVYDIEFSAGFLEQFRDKKPEIITYINMPEVQGCDYVIRAKGDSMADYINNMDWI
jgi:transcriptional regulator with XRE-family HTH domain